MKNIDKLLTTAVGTSIINKTCNEDFILGYLSSQIELTEDIKIQVKKIVEESKKYLLD